MFDRLVAKNLGIPPADSEDLSDRVDTKADLSLCWTLSPRCWFVRLRLILILKDLCCGCSSELPGQGDSNEHPQDSNEHPQHRFL